MRTNKLIFFLPLFLAMMLGVTGCSSDDESVRKNGYDELPAWLVPQAEALAEEFKDCLGDPTLFYSISCATGIHGETVYRIYRAYDSCLMCNLYDDKGNPVDYVDVFGKRDTIGDEGWKIIFPK